jgi:prepilin-type N-terminal cleavage/methylation domain-containing protein
MHYPQTKQNSGFSLPEVLIVVLTAAILAVAALLQLFSSLQLNRIQTASSLVASKLGEAKMIAVKQNRNVCFVLDETNSRVWIEANSTVIGSVENLPKGIKIKISPNTSATKTTGDPQVICNTASSSSGSPTVTLTGWKEVRN